MKKSKRRHSGLRFKKWVGVVSVVFKAGHWKTSADAADIVKSEHDACTDFPDAASDIRIVQDGNVEEDCPRDLKVLTFNENLEQSDSLRIQKPCEKFGLSVSFYVRSVQGVMRAFFPEIDSIGDNEA